jgi:hypothetical protein
MFKLNKLIGSEKFPVPGASVKYVATTGRDASFDKIKIKMNETKWRQPARKLSFLRFWVSVLIGEEYRPWRLSSTICRYL